jgi:hypothetical protein
MTVEDSPFPRRDAVTAPPPPDARWLSTPVRAFMRPGVVTVAEDASLLQVQRAMIAHGVHAVLISGVGGPLGWITAGALLPWLAKEPTLYSAASAVSRRMPCARSVIPPSAISSSARGPVRRRRASSARSTSSGSRPAADPSCPPPAATTRCDRRS